MKTNEFHSLLRNWLIDYLPIKRHCPERTLRTYRQSFRMLRDYFALKKISFEAVTLQHLSHDNLNGFVQWLREERRNSESSIQIRLAAVKSFLKYCALEQPELTALYMTSKEIRIKTPQRDPEMLGALSEEELKLLFDAPDTTTKRGRRDRFLIMLAYSTGMRIGELLSLQTGNILKRDKGMWVRIFGKGGKYRTVPLPPQLNKHLTPYLKEFHSDGSEDSLLFYSERGDERHAINPTTVGRMLDRCCRKIRETHPDFPEHIHAHQLRHSIATAMYRKGTPISLIRDFLGHSSVDTTMIYAKADLETIRKELEKAGASHEGEKAVRKWKGREDDLAKFCGL